MSDTPASAPAAPSAPAASPAPVATPAAPVHHAALQPREQGKFAGPPDPSKAPAAAPAPAPTPSWKVDGREFKDPSELATFAAEAAAERRALDEYRKQAAAASKRAAELEALTKDPRKAMTPELEEEILQRRIREFQEMEAVKAMSPEARELYLFRKQIQQEKAALDAEKAERSRVEQEAKQKAEQEATAAQQKAAQEEMKATLVEALSLAGLDPSNPWDFQRVAFVMRGAAERGVVYPPEVIARKVKEGIRHEQKTRLKAAKPAELLATPEVVQALNSLEDASLLRLLAPLGEKLRRLHLEALGVKGAETPTPVATGASLPSLEKPAPGSPEWERYFRERAKRGG